MEMYTMNVNQEVKAEGKVSSNITTPNIPMLTITLWGVTSLWRGVTPLLSINYMQFFQNRKTEWLNDS